ncbi:MAG: hypothetical protein LKJ03_07370 [Enterococcaceae bacterium]|jgi:hypothetical protein|nr:hypothetical protein [Enterococcaceae bacterium]
MTNPACTPHNITKFEDKVVKFHPSDAYNGNDNFSGVGEKMNSYVTKRELEKELEILDLKIDNKFKDLKLELKTQHAANVRWLIGTAITLAGVIITAIKLL